MICSDKFITNSSNAIDSIRAERKDTTLTDQELLKSILAINVLKLNTLYEIRDILCLQYNIPPDAYATDVKNTAEYSKTRQSDILNHLQDN